jgi:hypothetical protein
LVASIKDWPALYKEVWRCLKPGGWFEHADFAIGIKSDDNSIPPDCVWGEWDKLFDEAGERMGRTFRVIQNNVKWFEDTGFVGIESHPIKMPLGGWPADPKLKAVGQYNLYSTDASLEGYALFILTSVYGWEYTEVQVFIARVRAALHDKSIHAYYEG